MLRAVLSALVGNSYLLPDRKCQLVLYVKRVCKEEDIIERVGPPLALRRPPELSSYLGAKPTSNADWEVAFLSELCLALHEFVQLLFEPCNASDTQDVLYWESLQSNNALCEVFPLLLLCLMPDSYIWCLLYYGKLYAFGHLNRL